MKLPIELKNGEFVILITIDIDPNYTVVQLDPFYKALPKSVNPIFKKLSGSILNLYCICSKEEDFMNCLRQTGYKTSLL